MVWEFHVMVVANVTASSDELLAELQRRAARGACRFTLVMPAGDAEAEQRLEEALTAMREAGLERVSGRVGNPDPVVSAMEAWDPREFDEIVVSTLPTGASRWLGVDLPRRLERLTGAPVQHVVSRPRSEVHWERAPEHEGYGVLSPLAAALTRRS
jgi:hypothetical protein